MPSIFDFVNAEEIASYWEEKQSNRIPYLGKTLFPAKKQLGLDLSWIRGKGGLPVALTPSNYDAKATLRDRIGFSKLETEMPFFREAMRIGEKDRQELNKLMSGANRDAIMTIVRNIYDDITGLVDGAEVNAERMRMQLLSTGRISISANRIAYDYDYKFDEDHIFDLTGTPWSDTANATPIQDIQDIKERISDDTGEELVRAICTRKTWGYLMQNESIRKDIDRIGGSNIIMTDELLRRYLMDKLGIEVVIYNKKYATTVKNQSAQQFFPDDVFTLIPSGTLGNTYYGTTPEESDLMAGATDANVRIVDTGIAITTVKEAHPVNVNNIVSGIFLPSFERIDSVAIANVA